MTYRELLTWLTDLHRLPARAPEGERSGCMSSYDRASVVNPQTGVYCHWDANDDGTGCIRPLPDGGIVAFECEGPGVIWRIWSALPQEGHIRVFVDGEDEPQVDMPFIDWFEKWPGDIPPLNLSELSMRLSRGRVSYLPIPFQKGCRVELAKGWGSYYHFTYTRFAEGMEMPRYRERFSADGMIALAETDRLLYERGEKACPAFSTVEGTLAPGERACLMNREGAGCIEEMTLVTEDARLADELLETVVLRMTWDGRERAAVEAPLGAFFGGAPGYAHYRCLPMSMERGALTCRFPMPYQKGCRVEVVNHGCKTQSVKLRLVFAESAADNRNTLRFHAKWHRGQWGKLDQARFEQGGDRWPDWPLLLVHNACGRFCGVHLHVIDQWQEPAEKASTWWYGVWDRKTIDWWWGEGDEKFFVDGECFPSTFGTGSEDYIGYAWAAEPPFARFDSPYACLSTMPLTGNGATGVSRFHVADSIPFDHQFEGFIEKYKPDQWGHDGKCLYAAVPYWYQQADTDDVYPEITARELFTMRKEHEA